MKVSEVLSSFDDCLKRGDSISIEVDGKRHEGPKGAPLRIGDWEFVPQGNYDTGFPGFLARTEGVRIIWVYKEGIKRGDGSINGEYFKDVNLACREWATKVFSIGP